jgi:hypothetical protein
MWVALTKLKFKPSTFLQIPKQTQTQNVTPSKGQFLNFLEMIGRSIRFGVRKWVGWGIRNKHTNVKFFLYLPSSSQDLNVIVMSSNFFEKLPLFLKRKHPHRNKKKKTRDHEKIFYYYHVPCIFPRSSYINEHGRTVSRFPLYYLICAASRPLIRIRPAGVTGL